MEEVTNNVAFYQTYEHVISNFIAPIKTFETSLRPVIQYILPELAAIELQLVELSSSIELFNGALARSAMECLNRKLRMSINKNLIMSAAYLDPSVMQRIDSISHFVPRWSEQAIKKSVTDYVDHLNLSRYNEPPSKMSKSGINDENRNPKHWADLFKTKKNDTYDIALEMKNYERTEFDDNFDVLNFWKGEGKSYPLLQSLALKVLATPASSASSDRAFSKLRRIRADFTRNRLSEESISSLLCLGSFDLGLFKDDNEYTYD